MIWWNSKFDVRLEVRSTDPGVREDLPAWDRMTGNACWRSKKAISATAISYERPEPLDTPTSADVTLDLGEAGCGQLVMEIMFAMRDMATSQTLLVTAYDPAAPADIAAWCRMTGNTLVKTLPNSSGKQFLLKKGQ